MPRAPRKAQATPTTSQEVEEAQAQEAQATPTTTTTSQEVEQVEQEEAKSPQALAMEAMEAAQKAPTSHPQAPTSKVGPWDLLVVAVVHLLKGQFPQGVPEKEVVSTILSLKEDDLLVSLLPIPWASLQQDQVKASLPRKLNNSLWRACPLVPENKQAGGGYHFPPLLLRSLTGVRPVNFLPWSLKDQVQRFGTLVHQDQAPDLEAMKASK